MIVFPGVMVGAMLAGRSFSGQCESDAVINLDVMFVFLRMTPARVEWGWGGPTPAQKTIVQVISNNSL
jgi:hypothetical protein